MALVAEPDEVLGFIERRSLHGKGIGYVDVHLLASAALAGATRLWSRDKRLRKVAEDLGCGYRLGSCRGKLQQEYLKWIVRSSSGTGYQCLFGAHGQTPPSNGFDNAAPGQVIELVGLYLAISI